MHVFLSLSTAFLTRQCEYTKAAFTHSTQASFTSKYPSPSEPARWATNTQSQLRHVCKANWKLENKRKNSHLAHDMCIQNLSLSPQNRIQAHTLKTQNYARFLFFMETARKSVRNSVLRPALRKKNAGSNFSPHCKKRRSQVIFGLCNGLWWTTNGESSVSPFQDRSGTNWPTPKARKAWLGCELRCSTRGQAAVDVFYDCAPHQYHTCSTYANYAKELLSNPVDCAWSRSRCNPSWWWQLLTIS